MIPQSSAQRIPLAFRSFSSSTATLKHTSNIGKAPIKFQPTVSFKNTSSSLSVTGPRGTTAVPLEPYMTIGFPTPDTLALDVENAEVKKQRSMWGLTRTLIQNAVTGMTDGFTVPLYLVGVGYRAALEADPRGKVEGTSGMRLNMKLGFSHPVIVPVPDHIKAEVPYPTKIALSCTDKHQLGLFAAKVRKWRPPEPYKGKGIFVGNETIRIKAVKKK
ncbi:ribosomal protein L6, alpha-beta domain-containing protein [Russula ochroleuca]|jgi:large subunit ribosomal protein L6|uniref:Ribosomal protein L6, alpha-beta domain-containing protein n=1 Tax=Russula ochroleuca TaxID=152965 RepID=A0A9P5T7P8_9AGAM|nr:ribosomal protein L6, alpha-beta domain-containing protein [Russula ochroleuca]